LARFEVGHLLADRFQGARIAEFTLSGTSTEASGYFRLGPNAVGFGQVVGMEPAKLFKEELLPDVSPCVNVSPQGIGLPFNPSEVLGNLLLERYVQASSSNAGKLSQNPVLRSLYYLARPLLDVSVRRHLQRISFHGWEKISFPAWPVDTSVEKILEFLLIRSMQSQGIDRLPFIWFWPNGARCCAILTHDVETVAGRDLCEGLMDLDDSFGIKGSFQVVPEKRYPVPRSFLERIRARGFEVNVHDLNHDGLLYQGRNEFLKRAKRINQYGREFGASGFRSAVLYRNQEWFDEFEFSYDMSVPNVAHLDPQRGGCCTVFPYFIGKILELPVTTIQDYSLLHILNDPTTRLWQEQIRIIRENYGLISMIIHPDYIVSQRARELFTGLLRLISELRSQGEAWTALPGDVATWWRQRSQMKLNLCGGTPSVEGEGAERASVAWAVLKNDRLSYEICPTRAA
jgi:hypothetical protein